MKTFVKMFTVVSLVAAVQVAPACAREHAPAAPAAKQEGAEKMIPEAEARRIAAEDAKTAYKQLGDYDVSAQLEGGEWRVTYTPRPPKMGGGPAYVIDAHSGKIVSKKYYQ